MRVILRLDPVLSLSIEDGGTESITSKSFYKIHLKRYEAFVYEDRICFREGLSYIAMQKIASVLEKYSLQQGYAVTVDPLVLEYIARREMYLETRSKLGNELKSRDDKLLARFEDFATIVNQEFSRSLRTQQMWDAFFMTTMKKSCNFSVPGSGKTSSVYALYAFLSHQSLVKRVVVVCPKNAFGPWIDEFDACFGCKRQLNLFNIHSSEFTSSSQRRNAIKYECGNANLLLFNYECIKSFESEIASLIDDQTILVFDEVHKVKRINGEYARSAIEIAKHASYAVAMTGTPIPNTYQDIYNLLHILYSEEYDEFFGFEASGLRSPTEATIQKVNSKLQPFFCRTTKKALMVPDANPDSVIPVGCSQQESAVFKALFNKHKKNKLLLMLRILQLESNPQMLLSSIDLADYRYILDEDLPASEIDYADYSEDMLSAISRIDVSTKTQQCLNLVKGLVFQNKPVIIWCIFVKTIQNLSALFEAAGIRVKCIYGEVDLAERQGILESFKRRDFDVLITNPNTLAESISLHTVCHDAVYFEYSFNLVHLLQSKDRIHRLGLPDDQYTQFYFLQSIYPNLGSYYSMDEQIYNRLKEKEGIMLQAIDMNRLEKMPTSEEELNLIFSQLF